MSGILGGLIASLKKLVTFSFQNETAAVTNTVQRAIGYADFAGSPRWVMTHIGTSTTSSGTTYAHSTTGLTSSWTTASLPTSSTWGSIMVNETGTRMVISSGYINQPGAVVSYTSNGTTWTNANLPATGSHVGKFLNGTYMLTNRNTSNNVLWSTTAETGSWTTATVAAVSTLRSLSYGNVGGTDVYIIATTDAGGLCYRSTNRTTWSSVSLPIASAHTDVEFMNGTFVMVRAASTSTSYVYSNNGGTTWSTATFPAAPGNVTNTRIAASQVAGVFIMVFGAGTYSTSRDGITWSTPVSLATMTAGRIWDYAESPTRGILLATSDGAASGTYRRSEL